MYKLRADVMIEATDLNLQRGTGPAPKVPCPTRATPIWAGVLIRLPRKMMMVPIGMRSGYSIASPRAVSN